MMIDTGNSDPVFQKPCPIAMKHYQWVKEEIEKLLTAKVICSSRSSWSAPIIIVPKDDGGKHLVIDYRALNKVTRKFTLPMAKVEDIFSKLNGATYFTMLDLRAVYHHILLDKPSIPKTAFNSPFGKYEYIKVPFELAQAPAYFQELMNGILQDFNFVIPYLDDIIIFSKTLQEHLLHIRQAFEKLWSTKLSMKMSKCNFFSKEIQYLGHILSATGIWSLTSNTHAIQHMQPSTTPKHVWAFLGLVGYYRKFINGFAKIAKPLTLLTHQQVKWRCISKCLFNGKVLQHETDVFTHVKGLLYKHTMDSGKQFLALIIPKAWKYLVLVEGHNKLGNSHTYCLIKWQYYWEGMNKDIRKYIANCVLSHREKAKVQHYPLQIMEVPYRPFDKIAIDLVTECNTSTSGNKNILTIIDHLTGWPEAFPIPDQTTDTIVSSFIYEYLPVHMCPWYIFLDNGTEFKNSLMDQVLQQHGIDRIFSVPYHPQSNGKLEVFHKYLKPTLKNFVKKTLLTGTSI